MHEEPFDQKRKLGTNLTLLALYLILASHFAAPGLLDFFGVSLSDVKPSVWLPLKLVTSSLTELSPWFMIFALVPHFVLGFEVELQLGSARYALALLACGTATNAATLLLSFILNLTGLRIVDDNFMFASSLSPLMLCIICFVVLVPPPVGSFRNIGVVSLMVVSALTLVRCFIVGPVLFINFCAALLVDLGALKVLDKSVTLELVWRSMRLKDANWAAEAMNDSDMRGQAINGLAQERDETKSLL